MTNLQHDPQQYVLVHRHPRYPAHHLAQKEFDIRPVPAAEPRQPFNVSMLLIGVVSSGALIVFAVVSRQLALIVVGTLAVFGGAATPLVQWSGANRKARRRGEKSRETFLGQLSELDKELRHAVRTVRGNLDHEHPPVEELAERIAKGRVWQRRAADQDVLDVRLGTADIPSGLTVRVGTNSSAEGTEVAELKVRAEALAESARVLKAAPFVLSLAEHPVLSIVGPAADKPRDHVLGLVRAMVLELTTCCGPDELSLLVVAPPLTQERWEWTNRLPHAASVTGREFGEVVAAATDLNRALARLVTPRVEALVRRDLADSARFPRLLMIFDAYHPYAPQVTSDVLQHALDHAAELGIAVLAIADGPGAFPTQSTAILTVRRDGAGTARLMGDGAPVAFAAQRASAETADQLADLLAMRRLKVSLPPDDSATTRPLLDLIGRYPLPDCEPSWLPLRQAELLRATIGVHPDGEPFRLDLKEGRHGPHGLLVGAPGAGKSELLRSLVVSLALTHSPDQLLMVFADFKGGSTLTTLAKLPHAVGIVTNLGKDPARLERMREALMTELEDRQRRIDDLNSDVQGIIEYWKVQERRPELPPMPYLLVIIDELSMLLESDTDYLTRLLTIGKLGRSLGVYMLLGNQILEPGRMSKLESYIFYSIALRTNTEADSINAIGAKDAAALPSEAAGVGYFRPRGGTPKRFKGALVSVDREGESDLVRVVKWLSTVPQRPQLWRHPLPDTADDERLALDDGRLERAVAGDLPVVVGLIDDPVQRTQEPAVLDIVRAGGHLAVVGVPGTGKSTALLAEVLRAAWTYPANRLWFFIIDYSAGGPLAAAAVLPNVAGYATSQQPDRVSRIMAELTAQLDQRQPRAEAEQADVVLIIDDYGAFKENNQRLDEDVQRLLVQGASFGVHVHLSCSRWFDLGDKKYVQIANRIEFRLSEPTDSKYGATKARTLRVESKGRALGPGGLQWQFAAPAFGSADGAADPPMSPDEVVAAVAQRAGRLWPGVSAPKLRTLEEDLTAAEFDAIVVAAAPGVAVIGVEAGGFQPVSFRPGRDGHLVLAGDLRAGRLVLGRILRQLGTEIDLYLIDLRGDVTRVTGSSAPAVRSATALPEVDETLAALKVQLDLRWAAERSADSGGGTGGPILLVIDSYESALDAMPLDRAGLTEVSHHLPHSDLLGFSVVVTLSAADGDQAYQRSDQFLRRVGQAEAGRWQLRFGTGVRAPRDLQEGTAELIRPGRPSTVVQVLPPTRK